MSSLIQPLVSSIAGTSNEIDVSASTGAVTVGIVDPLAASKGGTGITGGAWTTSFIPTLGSGSGTITTGSASCGYQQIGKLVFIRYGISITANGTGATNVTLTLPVAPVSFFGVLNGMEYSINGKSIRGLIDPAGPIVKIGYYDGTYPGVNGGLYTLEGVYESS